VEGLCFNENKENITFGKEKIPCQLDDENRDLGYEQKYYFSDQNYKKVVLMIRHRRYGNLNNKVWYSVFHG
jgi:hypothetical protein